MDATDLCFAGAAEQARLIRTGKVSATELVTATLERIERINPKINAFNAVFVDHAKSEAAAIDRSGSDVPKGLLAGVPIALKDNVHVAGHVTSLGTSAMVTPAAHDAPLVTTLREAGAIIIGKTNLSDLAVWPFTETKAWGATRNPWDVNYSAGGSSGGSGAAVAAGLCGLAVGSDGLGSVRVPSSFNGVFGVKPQRDRIWHGPSDWKGMSVNGPLCRFVEDAALFLDIASTTAQPAFREALTSPPAPLRIALAWKSAAFYPVAARLGTDQRQAVLVIADVLRSLGHTVTEHEVGFPQAMSSNYMVRYLTGTDEKFSKLERPDEVSKRTRQMAALGRKIPDRVLRSVLQGEAKLAAQVNQIFEAHDVVLTPGAVEEPLKVGQLDGKGPVRTLYASARKIPNFAPWNAIGQPAVSVPAGLSKLGLPLSVQFAGKPNDEATLLALSAQIEAAKPWANERPAI